MAGVLAFTEGREKVVDFPSYPTAITALELMIPKPTLLKKSYVNAIWFPFQQQVRTHQLNLNLIKVLLPINYIFSFLLCAKVWIGLMISMVIGIASLYGIARCTFIIKNKWKYRMGNVINRQTSRVGKNMITNDISEYSRLEKSVAFIVGLLVVQGFHPLNFLKENYTKLYHINWILYSQEARQVVHYLTTRNWGFSYLLALGACLVSSWSPPTAAY